MLQIVIFPVNLFVRPKETVSQGDLIGSGESGMVKFRNKSWNCDARDVRIRLRWGTPVASSPDLMGFWAQTLEISESV
jgi:hypothetical protein